MARIAGIDLPNNKRVEIALTYIYGIGRSAANKILEKGAINKDTKVNQLSEPEVIRLRDLLDQEYKVEGDLRRSVATDIKRLMDIKQFRARAAVEYKVKAGLFAVLSDDGVLAVLQYRGPELHVAGLVDAVHVAEGRGKEIPAAIYSIEAAGDLERVRLVGADPQLRRARAARHEERVLPVRADAELPGGVADRREQLVGRQDGVYLLRNPDGEERLFAADAWVQTLAVTPQADAVLAGDGAGRETLGRLPQLPLRFCIEQG